MHVAASATIPASASRTCQRTPSYLFQFLEGFGRGTISGAFLGPVNSGGLLHLAGEYKKAGEVVRCGAADAQRHRAGEFLSLGVTVSQ
eukprot:365733-Chlamydomonas_euryale.AAC.22